MAVSAVKRRAGDKLLQKQIHLAGKTTFVFWNIFEIINKDKTNCRNEDTDS